MSVTWGTLKAQIARKLKDPSYRKYDETLLLDVVNDALASFASAHTGVASSFDLSGDGETYQFDLPENLVDTDDAGIYAVEWAAGEYVQRLDYEAGHDMDWETTGRSTSTSPLGYVLWPVGKITFTRIPEDDSTVTLYYVAYYDVVSSNADVILIPRWAEEAIKLYSAAAALEPTSAKTSNLRTYGTRKDSGDPEDNPTLRMAEYYMQRYYQILATHPTPQYSRGS